MAHKISVYVDEKTAERLDKLRQVERRPESQMAAILIEEGLDRREAKVERAAAK